MELNEPGTCTLWVKHVEDPEHSQPQLYVPDEQDEKKVIIMKLNTEHLAIQLVFRRAEFAKMMAEPNEGEPIECAIGISEDE